MPYKDGLALLRLAYEKERDEKIWQMWIALLPKMNEENYISFENYKNRLLQQTSKGEHKEQTVEEQLAMCKLLNAAYGGEFIEQ